jgi:hypothetical protein
MDEHGVPHGENNLENFGLIDFREMAKVDNSEKVDVVVQFDRNRAAIGSRSPRA